MMSSEERKQRRKTTARKHLIETLSTKQNGPFSLSRRHTMCYSDRNRTPQIRSSMEASLQQKSFRMTNNSYRETGASSDRFRSPASIGTKLLANKTSKICSFPAIVNDLNTFIYSGGRQNGGADSSFDALSNLDHQHRDLFKPSMWNKSSLKERQLQTNTCWATHRPLTPNLMKMLNKAKLPSNVQTERWVQQIPVVNRWRHSSINNLTDGNEDEREEHENTYTYRTWIFDGSRKRVIGSDF